MVMVMNYIATLKSHQLDDLNIAAGIQCTAHAFGSNHGVGRLDLKSILYAKPISLHAEIDM